VHGAVGVAAAGPPFGPVELAGAAWRHQVRAVGPALGWLRGVIPGSWGSLALGWRQFASDPLDEHAHLVGDEAQVAVGRGEHGEA
jgi:hypothetical protein